MQSTTRDNCYLKKSSHAATKAKARDNREQPNEKKGKLRLTAPALTSDGNEAHRPIGPRPTGASAHRPVGPCPMCPSAYLLFGRSAGRPIGPQCGYWPYSERLRRGSAPFRSFGRWLNGFLAIRLSADGSFGFLVLAHCFFLLGIPSYRVHNHHIPHKY